MNLRPGSCALTLAVLCAAAQAHAQTPGRITRESVESHGGVSIGQAGKAAVSADGRFVAFQSDASDLVPGDTNQSTDIFVRERASGVLQRVSSTWNGMEARGDSMCPALSADGRYVAFASRAWNMYPGGANLGHSRWDVYVHDRQAGTTARVSLSPGGGDPNGDSECPAISADGQRIAFASDASNLDRKDDNDLMDVFVRDRASNETLRVSQGMSRRGANGKSEHPVISAGGRYVAFESTALDLLPLGDTLPARARDQAVPRIYVRDLQKETTELVSVGLGNPVTAPNGASTFPSISADGRLVAFRSTASNLATLAVPPYVLERVFVRDRSARTTWLASPTDPGQTDCGREGDTFRCWPGDQGPPALSADGRFVAFSSRSLLHLPANESHGDQIYLFDNVGRRLRRLSVDPSGVPGTACSWSPALSGDGTVLAYAGKSANLVDDGIAEEANPQHVDVFSQAWTCNDAGRCRPVASCPARPGSCAGATRSLLRLRKHPPGGVNRDEVFWLWYGEATKAPFPNPSGAVTYQVCVYADALALDVAAPEAPSCSGAAGPCWRTLASGYKLFDEHGGITGLMVTSGSRSRRISLHGKGSLLDAPYLPLAGAKGIIVQLHETGTGQCWGTEFPATSITRNVAGIARMGSHRDGWLVAETR